jgi:hypothetical protein
MQKNILSLIWVIALLPVMCLAGEVNVKKLYKENWINIETRNFFILTNTKEKKAVEMAEELEHFGSFIALLLGYEESQFAERVPVILAKNGSSFTALGIDSNYAGVFGQGNGYIIFARADGFKSSSKGGSNWGRSVVLHELTHLFVTNSPQKFALPPWYNEGVAEYFGTYVEKKDTIVLGDMALLKNRFYGMLERTRDELRSVDTESLFKTKQADLKVGLELNGEHERYVNRFYARSVAVVHYLNADIERRKQMYQYLYVINQGYSVDEAFPAVFKMTFSELDEKVDEYISGKYVMARVFPIGDGGIKFADVSYKKNDISKRNVMEFLYHKISILADSFIDQEDREKMWSEFEKIYPDFFDN